MITCILTFEFDLILGLFLSFWCLNGLVWGSFFTLGGPNGLFFGFWVGFENCFWVYSYILLTFVF